MILERLSIYRRTPYNAEPHYATTVEFVGDSGKIELKLDEPLSAKILAVCSEALVAETKKAANIMISSIIPNVPVIEQKKEGVEWKGKDL